jgi:non-specific serine/threonine protein kinase/serine/threonine-protein kinase
MDAQFFERAEQIFHAAAALPAGERRAFLDQQCAGDEALRRELESLLAVADSPPSFLDRSPIEIAADDIPEEVEIALPARIGSYQLLRTIGRGGMGAVYEGVQDATGRRVAIKLIRPAMASAVFVRRFRIEQRILAGLEHPGIARLYDASTTDSGLPYLIMEYVDGANLLAYCHERGLSLTGRVELFERVCAAVQYAHQHLVVHRDLKPSNILITADGEPKLLDFGIAKLLHPDGEAVEQGATVTGLRLMTPEYASPEQIRGEPVTTAADVYSLGVVLYELVTGRRLYRLTTKTTHELERAVLEQTPTRPSTAVVRGDTDPIDPVGTFPAANRKLASALRGDLDTIVLRALAKTPAERYATADDLADDLRRHRLGLPVRARPDSVVYRARKFVVRHRWAVASAGVVAIALVAALVITLNAAAAARRERDLAARRFAEVRQLANVFLFDVEQKIRDIAGATAARELLVTTGLSYLDRLTVDAGDDPALLRELANGYDRLGDVQGGLLQSNLGQSEAALASYAKAADLRRRLTTDLAADSQMIRESARGELKLAQAMLRVGRVREAVPHSERAVRLLTGAPATGDAVNDTRERAEAMVNHGFHQAAADTMPAAVGTLRDAVSLYEGLPKERLEEAQLGRGYAFALFRLVQVLAEMGDPALMAEAIALSPRMIAIDRRLLAAEPHRADLRRGLIRDLAKLADLLADAGRHEEALAPIDEAERLLQQEVALDPQDRLARRNVSTLAAQKANALLALGRAQEALTVFEPAMDNVVALLAEDPRNLTLQVTFAEVAVGRAQSAIALSPMANDAERRRLRERVEPMLTKAIAILEPLIESKSLVGGDAAYLNAARTAMAALAATGTR